MSTFPRWSWERATASGMWGTLWTAGVTGDAWVNTGWYLIGLAVKRGSVGGKASSSVFVVILPQHRAGSLDVISQISISSKSIQCLSPIPSPATAFSPSRSPVCKFTQPAFYYYSMSPTIVSNVRLEN